MPRSVLVFLLTLACWLPASARGQVPIIVPRVGFSVSAHLVVPAPGVVIIDDWGPSVAVVDGVYWLPYDDGWHYWHPHAAVWVPAPPALLPPPLVHVKMTPGHMKFGPGPGIKLRGGGPHHVKFHGGGPGLKLHGGGPGLKVKVHGGGPGIKVKAHGGGPGMKFHGGRGHGGGGPGGHGGGHGGGGFGKGGGRGGGRGH